MNNGKVRIYELSKELNLDNKDILDICDRLNMTVKSHSSTITESDAEKIRAVAARYNPTHGSPKHSQSSASGQTEGGDRASESSEKQKDKGKQQILAIHHKGNRPYPTPNSQISAKQSSPSLSPPPARPQLPVSPSSKSKPEKSYVTTDSIESISVPLEVKTEQKKNTSPKLESPQLMGPPSRQKKEIDESKEHRGIVKPEKKGEFVGSLPKPSKTNAKFGESRPKTRAEETVGTPKPTVEGKRELKLQKPQRPKPPQQFKPELEAVSPSGEEVDIDEELVLEEEPILDLEEKPKPKLKRPNPPRLVKGKEWEDEEETEEAKAKAAKLGGKNKRRSKLMLDEDENEELESALSSVALPTSVSLSIARPPKPKSDSSPQPALAASRSKPNTAKSESSASRAEKQRQSKPEANVRPEKIVLWGNLTVRELAEMLNAPETEIIKSLFFKGIAVNITQTLDLDTARTIAEEMGVAVETGTKTSAAVKTTEMLDSNDLENLQSRPPVVTIMGHVDHGKTTLLDSIRKTKVAQGEAGGITQHIGAYHVDVEHEGKQQQIVFLDTPGHEAFTAMRARGAKVTDIAILVVAADDGVQPQTREAISHAKAAEVPIVVAINKVDKPEAEPDRIMQELTEYGLVAEQWGGETIMVPVSALKGENLDTLLEMIVLVAEIEELSANPDRMAKGTVIEANLDRAKGPVATLLVQNGTLRVGDIIVAGSVFGKIRAMIDDRGEKVEAATPSFAVEILGLNDVPEAGDEFEVFEGEKEARVLAEQRAAEKRESRLKQAMASRRISLSSLSEQAREGELKELNLILKADVQGSVEAILSSVQQLPQNEVQIRILLAAPGEITETDVALAAASGAIVVGFNTTLASGARAAADREGVDIREYNIIYKLLDDIQGAMEGLLDPEEIEEHLGQAEVRAVFEVGRGSVAGCYVQSGKMVRNRHMRVRRGDKILYEGALDSLKRIKEDVREVNAGYECGIGSPKFNDWKEGDLIEAYEMVLKRRTLSTK
jgi:translation initiation factor IF-2